MSANWRPTIIIIQVPIWLTNIEVYRFLDFFFLILQISIKTIFYLFYNDLSNLITLIYIYILYIQKRRVTRFRYDNNITTYKQNGYYVLFSIFLHQTVHYVITLQTTSVEKHKLTHNIFIFCRYVQNVYNCTISRIGVLYKYSATGRIKSKRLRFVK